MELFNSNNNIFFFYFVFFYINFIQLYLVHKLLTPYITFIHLAAFQSRHANHFPSLLVFVAKLKIPLTQSANIYSRCVTLGLRSKCTTSLRFPFIYIFYSKYFENHALCIRNGYCFLNILRNGIFFLLNISYFHFIQNCNHF